MTTFNIKSGNELLTKKIPKITHNINHLLPYGLSILVGRPKIGKSTFCYNLSFDSCSKTKVFDLVKCNKKKILYLSYEDNERKIQKIAQELNYSNLNNFQYSLDFPSSSKGIKSLENILNNKKIDIIIIDTMQTFFPTMKRDYNNTYNTLKGLKSLTLEKKISIILTHHTRKSKNENDVFDDILGSQGIRGFVDTTLHLSDNHLEIEGREIEYYQFQVIKQGLRFTLKPKTKTTGIEDKKYIEYIYEKGRPVSLQELYEKFNTKNKSTLRNRLFQLCNDGRLHKMDRALYEIGAYYDKDLF